MGKMREAAVLAPGLCESEDPGSWSYVNGLLFDTEVKDPGSRLARAYFDDVLARIKLGFGFTAFKHNKKKASYMLRLTELACTAYYIHARGQVQLRSAMDALAKALVEEELLYPEIAAVLTVKEASVMTSWN